MAVVTLLGVAVGQVLRVLGEFDQKVERCPGEGAKAVAEKLGLQGNSSKLPSRVLGLSVCSEGSLLTAGQL